VFGRGSGEKGESERSPDPKIANRCHTASIWAVDEGRHDAAFAGSAALKSLQDKEINLMPD
jgi:hypothetical protein